MSTKLDTKSGGTTASSWKTMPLCKNSSQSSALGSPELVISVRAAPGFLGLVLPPPVGREIFFTMLAREHTRGARRVAIRP